MGKLGKWYYYWVVVSVIWGANREMRCAAFLVIRSTWGRLVGVVMYILW
jgi:hypothetical protein